MDLVTNVEQRTSNPPSPPGFGGQVVELRKISRQDACAPRIVSPEVWIAEGVVGDVVGVDFETFYSSAYNVSKLGTWAYCRDPRFDAYLVAVADREKVCVCRPEDFPWESIAGLEWVSHNREFDRYVYETLTEAQRHGEGVPGEGALVEGGRGKANFEHRTSNAEPRMKGTAAPTVWHCSAAVCAFLQLPRDLAGAAEEVLGVKLDKSVRAKARGKSGVRGHQASPKGYARTWRSGELDLGLEEDREMLMYAAKDAVACLALWNCLGDRWPAWERRLFELTCEMGRQGLAIDWAYVEESRAGLVQKVEELKDSLPWSPALSIPKFKAACVAVGVPAPSSTAVDDPGFLAWMEEHRDTEAGGWARTMQGIRSANRTEKVLASMEGRRCRAEEEVIGQLSVVSVKSNVELRTSNFERRREELGDADRMIYELKYCGANTGRWSGTSGLNLQNLNRGETDGVRLRRAITAGPDHVLAAVDFAQIESRVLLWLAGDHVTLRMLVENPEMDLYEVHARATMGYGAAEPREDGRSEIEDRNDEPRTARTDADINGLGNGARVEVVHPGTAAPTEEESLKAFCARTGSTLRQLAKARVLGLGFGCGAEKFVAVAKSMAGLELGLEESERIVREYRESNPLVVGLWRRLENACRGKVGGDYVLPLPCTQWDRSYGRFLIYRGLRLRGRELICRVGGRETKVYGGLLAENWTQAAARDVLAEAWLRCVDAGYHPVLSVHDELVFELPEAKAKADLARIVAIMEEPVAWAPGLPLQAEGSLMKFYQK